MGLPLSLRLAGSTPLHQPTAVTSPSEHGSKRCPVDIRRLAATAAGDASPLGPRLLPGCLQCHVCVNRSAFCGLQHAADEHHTASVASCKHPDAAHHKHICTLEQLPSTMYSGHNPHLGFKAASGSRVSAEPTGCASPGPVARTATASLWSGMCAVKVHGDPALRVHGRHVQESAIAPGGAAAEELLASRLGTAGCVPRVAPGPRRPTCCAGPGSGRCGADTAPKTVLRSTFATPCGRSGNLALRSAAACAAGEGGSGRAATAGVDACSWARRFRIRQRVHGNGL